MVSVPPAPIQIPKQVLLLLVGACLCAAAAAPGLAHELSEENARYVSGLTGAAPGPFLYLGAKHMVTGLDHVLFLVGVIFFLSRFRDVALYVSLFTLGHSLTLLGGVLGEIEANPYLVDAVIGLSVLYKGFDNLAGFNRTIGWRPDLRVMVFGFGLIHGFGLATKLQALSPSRDGLITNIISFNLGVEIGQLLVLALAVGLLDAWRRAPSFDRFSTFSNICLMGAGIALTAGHMFNYIRGAGA